jgi:hypothetical protein
MTVIKSTKIRRSNGHHEHNNSSIVSKFLLLLACIWPILLLLFYYTTSTGPSNNNNDTSDLSPTKSRRVATTDIAWKFRDILDRVDILGYGPTHPRVAVVIVGDNKDNLKLSVESVFTNTDTNRIFLVVVVADGIPYDPALTESLKQFDSGTAPHWHEKKPNIHIHEPGQNDESHGHKVHVIFNSNGKLGLAESRKDAIEFIKILEKKHLESGFKSESEDLILLLFQSGAQLTVCITYIVWICCYQLVVRLNLYPILFHSLGSGCLL